MNFNISESEIMAELSSMKNYFIVVRVISVGLLAGTFHAILNPFKGPFLGGLAGAAQAQSKANRVVRLAELSSVCSTRN